MSLNLPRVLILYTGGTFGMDIHKDPLKKNISMAVPQLSPNLLKKRFLKLVPELNDLAHCDVDVILNRDSAHVGPSEWLLIAHKVKKSWKNYDGIVILHGTDTLAYTASALSFLLKPCLKPIVITGAQRPLTAHLTDGRRNLMCAVEIAAHGPRKLVNQVSVFFGDQLFQGNRIRKKSASDFSAFESPHFPPLAAVGTTIRYADPAALDVTPANSKPKMKPSLKLKVKPQFSQKVLMAHITPGFPAPIFTQGILPYLEGIVLVIYHSVTAPTHDPRFIEFLQEAQRRKIPITLTTESTSQPPHFENIAPSYAAGKDLFTHGCLWAGTMTPECAFVKTSLLVGQPGMTFEKFASLWKRDLAREGSCQS
jgi:L-asparaginase